MLFIGFCNLVFTLLDGRTPGTAALGSRGRIERWTQQLYRTDKTLGVSNERRTQ